MSDSTASAIPGYWTFTATSAPSWVRAAVHLADARRGGGLGIDLGEDVLGIVSPLTRKDSADLLPRHRRDVVAQRGEAALQILRLVGVEAGKLDRREHLPCLHRSTAHHGELVDE